MGVIGGCAVVLVAVLVGFSMAGGPVGALIHLSEVVTIGGASLGALGKRGRLVTCGGTSGPMDETDVRRLFWNQWTIMGSTMGNDHEFDEVVQLFRAGRLAPSVDSIFALENGRAAYERLASGEQFGKVVIKVGE